MKLAHPLRQPTHRAAFTLVELLVVIAIIIVLASLLLAAVFKAPDMANEATTRTEITQLSAAVQSFQTKYQVNYIPSRLVLCKQSGGYFQASGAFWSQLHQDSFEYLGRIWPRLNWQTVHPRMGSAKWTGSPAWLGIDWDNSDALDDIGSPFLFWRDAENNPQPARELTLEGEQTIVFFLGGIPGSGTVTGFSTDPSNPARHALAFPVNPNNNTDDRVPPFFEFKSNRLVSLNQWVVNQGRNPPRFSSDGYIYVGWNDFYAYLDGYGKTPYAYFSTYKNMNNYNRYVAVSYLYSPGYGPIATSDCYSLGVWPYAQSGVYPAPQPQSLPPPVYFNAQTFQLISAGKNLSFGTGTAIVQIQQPQGNRIGGPTWTPANATAIYPQGSAGYDDIANFYDRLLGVPTQ